MLEQDRKLLTLVSRPANVNYYACIRSQRHLPDQGVIGIFVPHRPMEH